MTVACRSCQQPFVPEALQKGVCMACRAKAPVEPAVPTGPRVIRPVPAAQIVEKANDRVAALKAQAAQIEAAQRAELEKMREAERERLRETIRQEELVEAEMARRVLARRHLIHYIKRFNPDYQAGRFHEYVCRKLEQFLDDVVNKRSPRLILAAPPRHGKSMMVSEEFPSWALGNYSDLEIISTSYGAQLAIDFSRKIRDRIKSDDYKVLFRKTTLSESSQASERWMTTDGGGYVAAGAGGPLTGRGADILILDDIIKNSEEAESFTHREALKAWYTTTAYTRLMPGGGVLVMATRWHDDDLSGWLEKRSDMGEGDKFEVIRFPAIAVEDEYDDDGVTLMRRTGEPLHGDRYPLDALQRIERAVGPRTWAALYQQNPVPDDGNIFSRDSLRTYRANELPPLADLKVYAAWDLAIGQRQHNDYTAGVVVGLDRLDNIWVLDVIKGRFDGFEIVEKILDAQARWKCELVGIEKGHIQQAIGPQLFKRIRERRQYTFALHELPVGRADKVARARPIQARFLQGKVLLPSNAGWFMDVVAELLRFPNGQHDDVVDALAHIGQMLNDMTPQYLRRDPPPRSWRDRLTNPAGNNSRKSAMSA